ncbi:transcriptional activator xlnR [Purpureocillium lavendulum]|uniref:Transcriptional activator xlnR n=1 Tax=Purpureocillium lavendulum TaxID=1247861 RepID=A0AB34FBQ7_9HYPO|nr:transcriptional activator xlnR [Purpureocillium lavendulum]
MAESAPKATTDTDSLLPDEQQPESTYAACYKCLWPVLPFIRNIMSSSVASELIDVFLTEPGSSLFCGSSPYILTTVFRKKSVLHPTSPRRTSPALLAAILWLTTSLVSERDPDRWRRTHGGLRVEDDHSSLDDTTPRAYVNTTPANEPVGDVDDVLTYILLSIAILGSDFKSDCSKWWSKAVRLAITLRLNRQEAQCSATVVPCADPACSGHRRPIDESILGVERQEERRRVFWLLYSLDRHLSLSFNTVLSIPDSYCEVYDLVWENLDTIVQTEMPAPYSTHILHVLHILLYGKWDAIAMLEDDDDWITSERFPQCTSHAIAASQSLSTILAIDPELAFMSYLFGIYLLQGSFIFLLFADRLPQLGPNESVQQACENIIRAHEVCVVTLSTEFQV